MPLTADADRSSPPLSAPASAGQCATVLEDVRLAVLPIEMVIMEWKLSREVVVIYAQGQSLEEHNVFHGFLVALCRNVYMFEYRFR